MTVALVTGAAGFIGSHVAQHLLELGTEVVALDDLSGGFRDNVPAGACWEQMSVTNYDGLRKLFTAERFDYVYHLAAYAAEGLSHFIRRYNYETNLIGSVNLINLSVLHKVKCFVFTSSIAVYGANQVPMHEALTPQPEDPYGVSKYAVELDLAAAHRQFGLDYIIFRPHNVYGEHQNIGDKYRNVIGIFMNQVLQGLPLTIFGNGQQSRAFSYIDDVAPIIARSVQTPAAYGQVFNVGGDQPYTVNELALAVCETLGVMPDLRHLPSRQEVQHAYASHDKVRAFFDLPEPINLRTGLARMAGLGASSRQPQNPGLRQHRNPHRPARRLVIVIHQIRGMRGRKSEQPLQPSRPDLTISLISADNLKLLLPCLRSVFENTHRITLEVFLVDNASKDATAAVVQAEFPQVHMIRNATRQGFSTNNNLVLRQGQGRYLILLNDDTLILDSVMDDMVAFMDTHPEAGAVGSYLLNPDHSLQAAFADFPRPVLEAIRPATNWTLRKAQQQCEPFEVDSVCGAAMLVRREVIDQVGILDTAFDPIYSEEVDWCYRIKQAGWRIYSLPRSRVIHYGSVTMNRGVPRKYELLLSHKLLFFRKHMGRTAVNIYRATLGLTTAFKVVWWTCRSLVDQRYAERRALHWYLLKRISKL